MRKMIEILCALLLGWMMYKLSVSVFPTENGPASLGLSYLAFFLPSIIMLLLLKIR